MSGLTLLGRGSLGKRKIAIASARHGICDETHERLLSQIWVQVVAVVAVVAVFALCPLFRVQHHALS